MILTPSATTPVPRILVAEDDPLNAVVIAQMLTRFGYDVVSAADGEEAVAAYISNRIQLVLMDSNMPRLNGIEALRKIREWEAQHERTPAPVVCLTGESFGKTRDALNAAGFTDFLAKPFRMDQLQELIESLLAANGNAT
jgi:CheY-like chemotaxis protein